MDKSRNMQRGVSFSKLDPVLMQSRVDRKSRREERMVARATVLKQQEMAKQDSFEATTISPTMSTRLDIVGPHCPPYPKTPGPIGAKYIAPKPKKWLKSMKDLNAKYIEDLKFCKFNTVRLPEPPLATRMDVKLQSPSADIKEAKIMPQRPSVTLSDLYPPPQKRRHLKLKKPKSGIFINVTDKEEEERKKREAAKSKKKKRTRRAAARTEPAGTETQVSQDGASEAAAASAAASGAAAKSQEEVLVGEGVADRTAPPGAGKQWRSADGKQEMTPVEWNEYTLDHGSTLDPELVKEGENREYTVNADGQKVPAAPKRVPSPVDYTEFTIDHGSDLDGQYMENTVDADGKKVPVRRGGAAEQVETTTDDSKQADAERSAAQADATMDDSTVTDFSPAANSTELPDDTLDDLGPPQAQSSAIYDTAGTSETVTDAPSDMSAGFGYPDDLPILKEYVEGADAGGAKAQEGQGEEAGQGEDAGEAVDEAKETYLTKIFRRKVSQVSKQTSIQSRDLFGEREVPGPGIETITMKYRRESEIERYEPPVRIKRPKRGTFESHSFTKLHQRTLKTFYFGVKLGSVHQADLHFPLASRNRQGICMPIAAYCYALNKHPNNWMDLDIDTILEVGNDLFLQSAGTKHLHGHIEELRIADLSKYCIIGGKKFRYTVTEPVVSGMLKAPDKKIFNLTKALHIFFEKHTAGILQTDTFNILIWKDKHYYFFDALPRTVDLYSSAQGKALMAHFYDLASVITVMLTRSGVDNEAFVVYSIQVEKILDKDAEDVDKRDVIEEKDNYQVLDETKAVLLGSFDLGDMCFSYSRNKQSLPMCVIALVYSKITPPSAWYKKTIDKIMVIGNRFFLECFQCDNLREIQLEDLPAVFTVGPYLVEVYIYKNRVADMMWRKQECMLLKALKTFFEKNTNGILAIDKYTLAVWKQRDMYHLFDPYSRDNQGFQCRDGAACTSMHSNLEGLVETVAKNFDNREFIFYVHSMKVVKIHRDPSQNYSLNLSMADYPLDDLIKMKMRRSKRCSVSKPVTVDFTHRAALYGASPDASLLEVGSGVGSLNMDQIPSMIHKFPSRTAFKRALDQTGEIVFDLDSPSLSDTQIEPERPKDEETIVEFMDLGQYDLTVDEKELAGKKEGEGEGDDALRRRMERDENRAAGKGEGEDFYMAQPEITQVHSDSLEQQRSKVSVQINTDLAYFTMPGELLPMSPRAELLKAMQVKKLRQSLWECGGPDGLLSEPKVTQSEELRRKTNFVDLPDGSQVVLGTGNMSQFGENDLEFMAPFICILAATVAKKYAIYSWSKEIVDYVLKCGNQLYNVSDTRYDQVYKLEIPKISLGQADYGVQVEYIFDTFMKPRILEMALGKILFAKTDVGILVTPSYACTLIHKNHLYYLYDGFGNNEVGLGQGRENKGVACLARFKNVHALATRIIHNKTARETSESMEYNRFVLSACMVKVVKKPPPEPDDDDYEEGGEGEGDIGGEGEDQIPEDEDDEIQVKRYPKHKEDGDWTSDDERKKEPKNKIGYQLINKKKKVYKIQGTRAMSAGDYSEYLKGDFFVCLCACLMTLECPIEKWDTKRMDRVLDLGQRVFDSADDRMTCTKKIIKNLLIEDYIFNLIMKRTVLPTWKANSTIKSGMETVMSKKQENILLQYPNRSYVICIRDKVFHFFDPCDRQGKASWTKYPTFRKLLRRIKANQKKGLEYFNFHQFELTSIRKAPKHVLVMNRVRRYRLHDEVKPELIGQMLHEDVTWLTVTPIPWSPQAIRQRPKAGDFCEEIKNDLYSLFGNLHQNSEQFDEQTRGKQTLGSLVVAVAMTQIYDLTEWSADILDSILINGDKYTLECIKDIKDDDYELSVDDLKRDCKIFPYSFQVQFTAVVEGTMFLMRLKQFNLAKALRYFFNDYDKRFGLICTIQNETDKRQVAFGKTNENEYFMFDCSPHPRKGFSETEPPAYVLRCTNLNRLLYVMVMTLRCGDFYIYDVALSEFMPIEEEDN